MGHLVQAHLPQLTASERGEEVPRMKHGLDGCLEYVRYPLPTILPRTELTHSRHTIILH